MKVRKAIKKIAALAAGATMVGATLLGASADLSDFPGNMMDNGKFDAYFVVGNNALAADVVGMTAIAAAMQAASVTTKYVSVGSAAETSVDDGVKIDKTSDHLYLAKDLVDVQDSALDDTDLPDMLADGNYDESEGNTDNDEDYTQEIGFKAGTGTVVFDQDDTDAPVAGWYLMFDDASNMYMYTYTLEFDNPIEYDNSSGSNAADDIEGTELEMQGQIYTILQADFDTDEKLDKLTLMAGETVLWLQQGEGVTRIVDGTEHEIEMIDVTEDGEACGFKVDGSTVWVDVDETETKNGVTIGVLDAKAVHTEKFDADICKVNIGASELILESGQEIRMNGKDIDGSDVSIGIDADWGWTNLVITYIPDDEQFLAPGDEFQDPVFGNFKFVVGNVVQKTETIEWTSSGDDALLAFTNNDGKEVEIPFYYVQGTGIRPGDGDSGDDWLYLEGETCDLGADVRDCEGAMFLVVTGGDEAHVIEIRDIDTGDDEIDFRDLTYDSDDNKNDYVAETNYAIGLGSGAGTITLNISEAAGSIEFVDIAMSPFMETETEARLYLNASNLNNTLFWEKDDDSNIGGSGLDIGFVYDHGTDDQVELISPTGINGPVDFDDSNSDDVWYWTDWGTTVLYDEEDDQSAVLTYPEEPAWLEVFFTPISATLLAGGDEGEVATQIVQEISSSAVKLASEVTEGIKNVNAIVVGGPCANDAAAELMGNPANCAEGFEEGHAKIALFENAGNTQLLVAGYSADDTRRGSLVVANYGDYATELVGTEVDVTGTSMSDISVGEPIPDDDGTGD